MIRVIEDASAVFQARDGTTSGIRRVSSVVRALDVLADPWSYLILREAFFGVRRFEDFQRNLGIARNILTERLTRLVEERVINRHAYSDRPLRFEYRLTMSGRDFYPAIVALMSWGDRWRKMPGGAPLKLYDCSTRRRLDPAVVCSVCGEVVKAEDVIYRDGPGAGVEALPDVPETRRRGSDPYLRGRPCSVANALQVIGDRWSFRIVREAFFGVRRFDDFQRNIGLARNILATRLKHLVDDGVLTRQRYTDRPPRFEYVLTEAGRDLYPSLLLFLVWGDKWRSPEAGPPIVLEHTHCGKRLQPRLISQATGNDVTAANVSYRMRYTFDPG